MTEEKVLPAAKTPPRYNEASIRFREAWMEYVEKGELVKFEIVNMIKILEADGYSRMEAIKKIVNDHNDLRGFSQRTIYRQLPDEMKRKYESNYNNMLPSHSDLSNDKFNKLQEKDENVVNITDSYAVKETETVGDTVDYDYYMEDENIEKVGKN